MKVTGEFVTWAKNKPTALLGARLQEYVAEATHQNWDGYPRRDLPAIKRLLADFLEFVDNYPYKGAK